MSGIGKSPVLKFRALNNQEFIKPLEISEIFWDIEIIMEHGIIA